MSRAPVALFIYRRPDLLKRVVEAVLTAAPPLVLVVADGPRSQIEEQACEASRKIIEDAGWRCEVRREYSEVNLGCRLRISSGIDWVFQQCDGAILIEEDCVPDASFFLYCDELLARYAEDERVMMISGTNHQPALPRTAYSYWFSRFLQCSGGWATWRRAWQLYDLEMRLWPALREPSWLGDNVGSARDGKYWLQLFDAAAAGEIDTWDYQWFFACWANSGLSVMPESNLVSNIGFGADATHTHDPESPFASYPLEAMRFPLRHPPHVTRNIRVDQQIARTQFPAEPSLLRKVYLSARRRLGLRSPNSRDRFR